MFTAVLTLIVIAVGTLIGGIGIGGVLLVPALKYLGAVPIHVAIPACMMAYIATGLIGAIIYARQGTIDWSLAIKICLGALPGAYIGAFILPYIPALGLELVIGILILVSGVRALRNQDQQETRSVAGSFELISIGLITGIGSALSGTGGPLLLIPILLWRRAPILTAIGLSQAVQVPISLTATVGNIMYSSVDLELGLMLAIFLGGGAILGAKTAHLLPIAFMKKFVAGLLVVVGLAILLRIVYQS